MKGVLNFISSVTLAFLVVIAIFVFIQKRELSEVTQGFTRLNKRVDVLNIKLKRLQMSIDTVKMEQRENTLRLDSILSDTKQIKRDIERIWSYLE